MRIKLTCPEEAFDKVKEWAPSYLTREDLPRHVWIAYHEDKPIAMAALRMSEHPMCVLDSMATCSAAPAEARNEALDFLTCAIADKAKELGYKTIFAYTTESSIITRALKHKFDAINCTILVRTL